ncbi:MAG: hypothetical protein ABR505_10185 [Actinomycetota bacterium]
MLLRTTVVGVGLAAFLGIAPAADAVVAVAGPGAYAATYATPVVVTVEGGPVTFVNADIATHTFTASEDFLARSAAKKAPWCKEFSAKKCPLFTATASTGGSEEVAGVEHLQQGEQYAFVCTIHPNMTGTLVVAPGYGSGPARRASPRQQP